MPTKGLAQEGEGPDVGAGLEKKLNLGYPWPIAIK
jgi:hypothetical protein